MHECIDQELTNVAALANASCSRTRWQHFVARNDVMAVSLKVCRHIQYPPLSINA